MLQRKTQPAQWHSEWLSQSNWAINLFYPKFCVLIQGKRVISYLTCLDEVLPSKKRWMQVCRRNTSSSFNVRVFSLRVFANLRKPTIRLLCPTVRWNSLALSPDGFSWNLIFEKIFRNFIEKIQVSLKSDKNNRYFTWRPIYIFDHI